MLDETTLTKIDEMKEAIQDFRIWFNDYSSFENIQELRKLKDHIITIKLESELLIDKINKKLIQRTSLR